MREFWNQEGVIVIQRDDWTQRDWWVAVNIMLGNKIEAHNLSYFSALWETTAC